LQEDTLTKRVFFALLVTVIVTSAQAKYSGGSGTPEDPYLISTSADMNQIGRNYTDLDKCFKLTADINLSAYTGTQFSLIGLTAQNAFSGVFDGNGHTISGFTYTAEKGSNIGVFGYNGGTVENVSLVDVNVIGSYIVGGLVGINGGYIRNCYSTGVVSGSTYVGGLVGENGGSISNCYSTGNVNGPNDSSDLGGLVGWNYMGQSYSSISNCHSTGTVTGGDYSSNLGGLVGYNSGRISNCFSTGAVAGGDNSGGLGGLVGYNYYGPINNCYSTGSVVVTGVYASLGLGGLVGESYGSISDCYSTGDVNGGYYSYDVGGLVGESYGSISSSYFLITSGPNYGGGTPLTDAQMKQQSSFAGWSFSDVWHICETTNYPKLIWQIVPGYFVCPDGVDFADYSSFAERWLNTNCASNNNCNGADLDFSGTVDIADLAIMCDYWLKGF